MAFLMKILTCTWWDVVVFFWGQGETAETAEMVDTAEMAKLTALLAIIVLSMLRMIAHGSFTLS